MTNLEIYYKNTISILECKLSYAEEVFFDINFQLKDEGLSGYSNQSWRKKARFKLRKVNAEISKLKDAIKKQKRKLSICTHFKPQITGSVVMRKQACIASIEHEVICQIFRSKLKDIMGVELFMEYVNGDINKAQDEIRKSAEAHFESSNRMPAAIEIYNWKV